MRVLQYALYVCPFVYIYIDPIYFKFIHKIECISGSAILEDGLDPNPDLDLMNQYPQLKH